MLLALCLSCVFFQSICDMQLGGSFEKRFGARSMLIPKGKVLLFCSEGMADSFKFYGES